MSAYLLNGGPFILRKLRMGKGALHGTTNAHDATIHLVLGQATKSLLDHIVFLINQVIVPKA